MKYFLESDRNATAYGTLDDAVSAASPGEVIISVLNDGSVMGSRAHYYVNRDKSVTDLHAV